PAPSPRRRGPTGAPAGRGGPAGHDGCRKVGSTPGGDPDGGGDMTDRTPADGPDAEERIEALSALLQTEDAGIQNASQVSMALAGIVIAYLPVSVFAVYQADFPTGLSGFLPWPVVFLMLYQTVMLAGTSRRARSARLI